MRQSGQIVSTNAAANYRQLFQKCSQMAGHVRRREAYRQKHISVEWYVWVFAFSIFQTEITYSSLCHKTTFIRLVCSSDPKNNKRCT